MRLPTATRIEETARVADQIEAVIRSIVPADEIGTVLDNLGVAVSGINKTYSNAGTYGSHDGEIQVSLNPGHRPTEYYVEQMRRELPRRFPGVEFFFQPADMVTQILNFGLPSAIDVKVTGPNLRADYDIAAKLMKQIQMIPGTVDTHIHQRLDQPAISLAMDRTQLQHLGLSPNDVTTDLLVSTSGTSTTAPAFWLSPANGVVYNLTVQSPQYAIDSLDALLRTPVRAASAALSAAPQLLSNLVSVAPTVQEAVDSRYNLSPTIDIFSSAMGRDMGGISVDIRRLVSDLHPHLPRGVSVDIRGQTETMKSSFVELGVGLVMAVVMV
jgi:multidrug efflux pump subunit AcrB